MLIGAGKPSREAGAGGAIPYVTEREFEAEVLRAPTPVLVQFTAEWCQPCKQIAPEVEAFAKETAGKLKIVKVDVDKSKMLAQQLRIQSVPTFMLLSGGRPVDLQAGALGRRELRAMVEPHLPRAEGALKAPEVAQLIMQGQVVAIDTREAAAFARAHIPRATNMPLEEIENRIAELYMVGGAPVLYCRSGDKSKALAEKLALQGVEVSFIEGGFLAWEAEALPVERP